MKSQIPSSQVSRLCPQGHWNRANEVNENDIRKSCSPETGPGLSKFGSLLDSVHISWEFVQHQNLRSPLQTKLSDSSLRVTVVSYCSGANTYGVGFSKF